MPSIVAFAGGAFAEIVAWLAARIGERTALFVASVAGIAVLYGTLIAVGAAALAGIEVVVPYWVARPLSWFLPSQFGEAMAFLLTIRVARWVYDHAVLAVMMWGSRG